MNSGSLSEVIADFALNVSLGDVPQDVQHYAKLLISDAIGVAIASFDLEHAKSVRNAVTGMQSRAESTLWGTARKASMADAALHNGALIHGLDYDDTHVAGVVHPSASVVSTALTVGEATGASGQDILSAIICGWEIIIRLGLAAQGKFHDRGFHATGILSPFASACVAAKLMKLPKSVLVNALGICGSQAAALQQFLHDGSWVKKIHPGWANHAAIYAVMMAKEGFVGPTKVFEGSYGVYASHLDHIGGLEQSFQDLGQKWLTSEIAVKLYPCCHFIHSFIDIAIELKNKYGFTAEQIERIECRTEKRFAKVVCEPEQGKKRPASVDAMRFSLPYIVSMAILKNKVGPQEIDPQLMQDRQVVGLIDKIDSVTDETAHVPGHFPGWMKVVLKDGNEYKQIQPYERGSAENPIRESDIITKFRNNAGCHLPAEATERLLGRIAAFDQLHAITEVIDELRADRKE